MSSPHPPRRSSRKRTLTEAISDDVDMPLTFAAKVSNFAYSTSSPSKRRAVSTHSNVKTEDDFSGDLTSETASTSTSKAKPKSRRPTKKKVPVLALDVPHLAPPRWREIYETITEMRKQVLAPVDGMGCGNAGDAEEDPKCKRLSILISLMLSSQTKDEVTHAAVAKLRAAAGGVITLDRMLAMDTETLQGAINKVGFWPKKTTYIMEAMKRLRDDFNSDVPNTIEELTSLKGVGPKMGFLALQNAWNINTGIGVDVHVHRISNLLGWHKPPTKTPEQTRLNLQSWLPTELWNDINPLLVGFGQTICLPVGRRCSDCTLSSKGLCPSANVTSKGKGGKPRSPLKQGATPFLGAKLEALDLDTTVASSKASAESGRGIGQYGQVHRISTDDKMNGGPQIKIELEADE